jgi:hypothetical protein
LNSWQGDPSKNWRKYWEGLASSLDKDGKERIDVISEKKKPYTQAHSLLLHGFIKLN